MNPNDLITVHVSIVKTSRRARRVTDGELLVWLPRSQIIRRDMIDLESGECHLVIPRWLAKEKNLEEIR